ncbi:hypothetical protein [Actinokineospora terrae]|uniref:DUF4034 domain-containing protein n=1 Tax=Actinokineospora terrae TaxID=155974 RepID=A0A1H9MSQ3_9PSEU|nr:hypothetical protein [Actinokineospora terrae]SER26631.1 hypothetical protein SAMN04487818_102311 [Actinokineospora terrae]
MRKLFSRKKSVPDLVPDEEVSDNRIPDHPGVLAAYRAALGGDWEPAAEVVASTWGDWEARADVVFELADAAAQDDAWLTAWRAARPDDPGHAAVLAQSSVLRAWEVRGAQKADQTTPDQVEGFQRLLTEGRDAARVAAEAAPEDPTPWWTQVMLARGLPVAHAEFEAVWAELVARDPLHRYGHIQALQYWCAKWHGSDELMTDFATRAAAKSPRLALIALLGAFEHTEDRWRAPDVVAALDALIARLATETVETNFTRKERGWAIHALMSNNRPADALTQFRALGARADNEPWSLTGQARRVFLHTRDQARAEAARP